MSNLGKVPFHLVDSGAGGEFLYFISFVYLNRSYSVSQPGLGLTVWLKLPSNVGQFSPLTLLSGGITGVSHHTHLSPFFSERLRGKCIGTDEGTVSLLNEPQTKSFDGFNQPGVRESEEARLIIEKN